MFSFESFFSATQHTVLEKHHKKLETALTRFYQERPHGRQEEWQDAFNALPRLNPSQVDLSHDLIQIGSHQDIDEETNLKTHLKKFMPWRKGPFELFGVNIDTEWQSGWKWSRIQPHLACLKGRKVLDVGCGNGYHLYRMLGEGATLALGVDPTRLFQYQFELIRSYLHQAPCYFLPLKSEHLPAFNFFDSVFSMGVLYHRRSPLDHLHELLSFLRPGGELVLETLVIDDPQQQLLTPEDRYAKMANVWFLPCTQLLELWLKRLGFREIRTVDVNQTSTEEQRSTEWMTFQSLSDFLDVKDPNKTIEGYPAPRRATVIALKPE